MFAVTPDQIKERLSRIVDVYVAGGHQTTALDLIENALAIAVATERRRTIGLIRDRLEKAMQPSGLIDNMFAPEIFAILDAEAAA